MAMEGNEPAFPIPYVVDEINGLKIRYEVGLTKREYFAGLAMQGIVEGDSARGCFDDRQKVAEVACEFADALLAELSKEREFRTV